MEKAAESGGFFILPLPWGLASSGRTMIYG